MAVLIGSQPGATFALPQRDTLNYGAPASVAIGPTPTDITMNTGVTPGTTVATPYVPTANDVRLYLESRPDITDAQIVDAMNQYNISPEMVAEAAQITPDQVRERMSAAGSMSDLPIVEPEVTAPVAAAPAGPAPTSMFDTALDYMKFAAEGTKGLTDYTPTDVTAGTLPQVDISQYMNPYTQEVIDKSLADLERNRLMQQQTQAAQASAAGAFGGSRQGVAQALTNEAFARQAGQMASQLRQTGYTQAQQLAGTDLERQMQADLVNQAAGLQGAQFQLGAQSQLGGMGLTGFNLAQQQYDQFMANEAMKQAMQNQLYAQQAGQATSFFGQPAQALGYLPGAISGMPYSQTTTAGRQPGAFDYLTLGAYMFA